MSICRAHKCTQPKYSHNASKALRVPTVPQTHESLCCSEAVDIQNDERLQRCCGTASWRQLADSWKCLIFNQVQCHLWKTTDSVAGVFKCRHRGREHWWAGYLRLKIAVLTARAGLTSCLFQARTVSQFGRRVHQHGRKFTVDSKNSQNQHVTRPKTPLAKSETENQLITGVYNPGRNSQKGRILRFQGLPSADHRSLQPGKKFPEGENFTVSGVSVPQTSKNKMSEYWCY